MQITFVTSLSLLALLASTAAAQAPSPTFSINPAEVSLTTKAQWCQGESSTCIQLCDNNPLANSCDPTSLNFTCTCQNGSAPGLQYYLQSMPTFICNQAYQDCIAANTNSAQAQSNCTNSIKDQCGTLNAASVSAAQSSTTSAGSASSASSPAKTSASGSGSAAATPKTSAVTTSSSKAAGATPTGVYAAVGNGAAMAAVGLLAYLV